jgi:Xaa-Pro aminopeptidase
MLITEKSINGWCFGMRLRKPTHDKCVLPNCIAYISDSAKPIVFCDLELEVPLDKDAGFDVVRLDQFEEVMHSSRKTVVNCNFPTVPLYFPLILQKHGFSVQQSKGNISLFESIKNDVEISNMSAAAELTSVAFIKALSYAETCDSTTEIGVIDILERELRRNETFIDLSFNAISAFGRDTTVVHFNPKALHNTDINSDGLFLLDAGAHFVNATTDMTRVVYRGSSPDQELINIYTTVLRSVITFSMAKFQDGTKASLLDTIARFVIWSRGSDYAFGTGHGIGSFGNVHERPSISQNSNDRITSNMIVTIEPGIYMSDFGVRLENMLATTESPEHPGYVEFRTLNLIPFCRKLIDKEMLSRQELEWLNLYHKHTYEKLSDSFKDDSVALAWLTENTMEI